MITIVGGTCSSLRSSTRTRALQDPGPVKRPNDSLQCVDRGEGWMGQRNRPSSNEEPPRSWRPFHAVPCDGEFTGSFHVSTCLEFSVLPVKRSTRSVHITRSSSP